MKILKDILEVLKGLKTMEGQALEAMLENKKKAEDRAVYVAIGYPEQANRRIELLLRAKELGFFDEGKVFSSLDSNGTYKHCYSKIAYNYRYSVENDTLRIPSVGQSVCIYKKGEWATVEDKEYNKTKKEAIDRLNNIIKNLDK